MTRTSPGSDAAPPAGRTVVERPPPGLARGRYAWPAWAVAGVGSLVVLATLAYLAWRWRRRRRRRP